MRYGVHYYQSGGCDYTIGCGHRFIILPDTVTTMEQAEAYVKSEGDDDYSLGYFGVDRIDSATIVEISQSIKVDVAGHRAELQQKQDEANRQQQEVDEKELLKKLQAKHGTS